MKINQIIIESRISDDGISYEETEKQVIANLLSYKSQTYTKLAQKVARIRQLEEEVNALNEEVKQTARLEISDLFDAEDAVKTRIIKTVSLIIQISKDPEPTIAPKYKDIVEELTNHLTPELIAVLEHLKKTMVTVTQKEAGLKVKPIDEGRVGNFFAGLKQKILGWARGYDQKLAALYSAL
jgi:uncharacterized protein (UPF0335 family)